MSNPTNPFSWQMPENTDLVTDLPADFEVFGQAVATSMADLLGGTTGQVLAKASNTDMDFVWSADAAGMTNPMTTTGDVIYSSPGSTPVRLGIGSAGQVMTVASGVPSWATPSSGAYTLLSTTNLSGTSTTISSISGAYTDLMVITNDPFLNVGGQLRINPNSTSGISLQSRVVNTTAGATTMISSGGVNLPIITTAENTFILQIFNYAQTIYGKNFSFSGNNGLNASVFGGGVINTTAAISALEFTTTGGTSTFSGGQVLIYGVK